jgi:hypothetical protein
MVRRSLHRRVGGPLLRTLVSSVAGGNPVSMSLLLGPFGAHSDAIAFEVPLVGPSSGIDRAVRSQIVRIPLHRPPSRKNILVGEWLPSYIRARDFLGVGGGPVPGSIPPPRAQLHGALGTTGAR